MAIKTFNANRVGGGTFSVEQDASTGEYKLKETGFLKLPELKLPELGTTTLPPVTGPVPTPDEPAINDPCPPGYRLIDGVCRPVRAGGGGGGSNMNIDLTGKDMLKNIQKEATGKKIEDTKIESASNIAYKNYEDTLKNYNAAVERNKQVPGDISQKFIDQLESNLNTARANVGMSTTGDMKVGAPGDSGFEGPDRGIIEPSKPLVDPITGAGRSQSVKFKERFDPTEIQAADPIKKNIVQKVADFALNKSTFKVGAEALGAGIGVIAKAGVAIGDALLGVTDVDRRRREADSSAAKSLGYTTVGELGGSTDPGRIASVRLADGTIATSSADSVFVGFNRDSAKGNLSQAAANRIETRMTVGQARVDKKYGANSKQANDFRQKTKDFQKEANDFNSQKEKEKTAETKSQNPNLRAGAGGEGGSKGGGKIVCTMMNESYGFGSFRNKIWMKFHGNISPEYQKGYHKLFLPLVNYAKQKGITNKIIKNILEHIAVHSTIDMRQSLRGKTHMLGRVYRKIILPLCYWAGRK